MSEFPLVSVALCTYNGELFLQEQLNSILEQTYSNLEIVIVDDVSTDGTLDILRDYKDRYDNIRLYFNDSNQGVHLAFSKAISLCKGEFIAISDQDDIWLKDKIEVALKNITSDITLVYSNSLLIDYKGYSLNKRMFGKYDTYLGGGPRVMSLYNSIAGHTMLFRSEIKKYILPIPKNSYYDWWIALVAINVGNILYLKSLFVKHRIHANNISRKILLEEQDLFKRMGKWIDVMNSLERLKYRCFFERLSDIFSGNRQLRIKKNKISVISN